MFATFFQRQTVKKCGKQECKKQAVLWWIFLTLGGQNHDFWSFWRLWATLLAHFEDFWPILRIFGIVVIFGAVSARKCTPFLESFWSYCPTFGSVVFQCFFERSLFLFFVILGGPGLHFGSHFASLLGSLGLCKKCQKCTTVVNFRGLTPSRQSLFASLDYGCVLMTTFCRFL